MKPVHSPLSPALREHLRARERERERFLVILQQEACAWARRRRHPRVTYDVTGARTLRQPSWFTLRWLTPESMWARPTQPADPCALPQGRGYPAPRYGTFDVWTRDT